MDYRRFLTGSELESAEKLQMLRTNLSITLSSAVQSMQSFSNEPSTIIRNAVWSVSENVLLNDAAMIPVGYLLSLSYKRKLFDSVYIY